MTVRLAIENRVARVTIDRPERLNAIDEATESELFRIWEQLEGDRDLRLIVLTGAGDRSFCAGHDLKQASNLDGLEYWARHRPGGYAGLSLRDTLDVPVLARVNGYALGGGMVMMLGCDIIVAEEHATFALPEINVGVLPDCGVVKLRRRIPYHVAVEFMMTGRWMDAAEAKHWGLVNHVVPTGGALARAREIAATLADGPPLLYPAIKQVLRMTETVPEHEAFAVHDACATVAAVNSSEDLLEGARAFAEKRKPNWRGR